MFGHCKVDILIVSRLFILGGMDTRNACGRSSIPVWTETSARVVTCRYIWHAFSCSILLDTVGPCTIEDKSV